MWSRQLAKVGLMLASLLILPQAAYAQGAKIVMSGSEGYAQRPLTLPTGHVRVDLGPPDFGYMDHGLLNNRRGLNILVPSRGDASVGLGLGAAVGVMENLEVGTLLLPFALSPDFDFGDIELYGRYEFLQGRYELAAQLTVNIPTDTDFGFGIGVPALFEIGDSIRVDTGAELEVVFYDDTQVNLDIPAAFSVEVADIAFVGVRTGLFVRDFDDIDINLGAQAGVTLLKMVDLTASFNWPFFISSRNYLDAFNLDWFQIIFGGTLYFDVFSA